MLFRNLLAPLVMAMAAAVASADLPTCPGLSIAVKGPRKGVLPGKRIVISVGVKNSGSTVVHGMGLSVTCYKVTHWQGRSKKLSAPIVDGATTTWIDQPLGPKKSRRYKLRAQVCRVEGDIVADQPETIAEISLFRVNADGEVTCMTSAAPLTATYQASVKAYRANAVAPVCPLPPPPFPLYTHAYVNQYTADNIQLCTLNADGTLGPCEDSGAPNLSRPAGITIHNGYAYITNYSNNGQAGYVTVCKVNPSTKKLEQCVNNAAGLPQVLGIAVSPDGKWAYISPYTGQDEVPLKRCTISSITTVNNCLPVTLGGYDMTHLTDPWTVGAQNGYLFVVDYAYSEPDYSGVIPCKIDEATGALSDCALTTAGNLFQFFPTGVAFSFPSSGEQYAYFAVESRDAPGLNLITACKLNGGQLSDCVATGGEPWEGDFIAGMVMDTRTNYIYFITNDDVIVCDVDGLTVSNCRNAGSFTVPHGIVLV